MPSTVLFLSKSPLVEQFDLSSLKDITSGAAPLGEELSKALKERLQFVEWFRQGGSRTEISSKLLHGAGMDNAGFFSTWDLTKRRFIHARPPLGRVGMNSDLSTPVSKVPYTSPDLTMDHFRYIKIQLDSEA